VRLARRSEYSTTRRVVLNLVPASAYVAALKKELQKIPPTGTTVVADCDRVFCQPDFCKRRRERDLCF
jgi:hypothetical protein